MQHLKTYILNLISSCNKRSYVLTEAYDQKLIVRVITYWVLLPPGIKALPYYVLIKSL